MFIENQIYFDRRGLQYIYLRKNGGVTVFQNSEGKLDCRNHEGMYRWDGKQTDLDILSYEQ
jgi:hypothetical protein